MSKSPQNLVNVVKEYFDEMNIKAEFWIAGGSVFSTLTQKYPKYSDIDVFFYDEETANRVIEYIRGSYDKGSVNLFNNDDLEVSNDIEECGLGLSIEFNNQKIQFIKINIGNPMKMMENFDINCSKVCITSDNELLKSENWTNELEIDYDIFNAQTMERFEKYQYDKEAVVTDARKIELFEYILYNLDREFDMFYKDAVKIRGICVIDKFLNNTRNSNNKKIFENLIIDKFKPIERIQTFCKISQPFKLSDEDSDWCDELKVAHMLMSYDVSQKLSLEEQKRLRLKFPAHFL